MSTVFITGGTGFLGARVLRGLLEAGFEAPRALVRPGREATLPRGVEAVSGDLENPESYRAALGGCDLVLHLAALTGKARRRRHFAVNLDGTRALVEASRSAGVPRFVFVSSIAAAWERPRHYHYADAKRAAETLVRASGLRWTILRPTMIFGEGSPVLKGLATLAGAPFVPVFGNGRSLVQPISVDDLGDMIVDLLQGDEGEGETWELGGADRLTIEELLLELRKRLGKANARRLHLPLGLTRGVLALMEPLLLPLMPLTAGQLASFAHDGCAEDNPLRRRRADALADLDALLHGVGS